MTVAFRRVNDIPPPEFESLTVDRAGAFSLWRSTGNVVGSFAGHVPVPDRIAGLADAARQAPVPSGLEIPADASIETLEVDGARLVVESGENPGGPWGALVVAVRALLDSLRDSPLAAIALSSDATGHVRLAQRGPDPLTLELGRATFDLVVWHEGREVGRTGSGPLGPGRIEAGPGWATDVELPHVARPPGSIVVVTASFVVDRGGVFVPVHLSASDRLPDVEGGA